MIKLSINKKYNLPVCHKCKYYTYAIHYIEENKKENYIEIVCMVCLRKQLVDLLKNNEYKKAKALQDRHPNVFYQVH